MDCRCADDQSTLTDLTLTEDIQMYTIRHNRLTTLLYIQHHYFDSCEHTM